MKKIAGKIAMILILLMLAHSFSGCTFFGYMISEFSGNVWWAIGGLAIDIIILLALGGWQLFVPHAEAPHETETGIYLANAEHNPLTDYYSVMDKINSLPETEKTALMEKLNSLPEAKLADLTSTVTSLPQAEITVSIERLNALSRAELASVVQTFNSLSEAELDALVEKLNSKAKTENVVLADNFITLPETNIVSLKNDLQYYNVGMRLCYQ
jgi:hypothetical protein